MDSTTASTDTPPSSWRTLQLGLKLWLAGAWIPPVALCVIVLLVGFRLLFGGLATLDDAFQGVLGGMSLLAVAFLAGGLLMLVGQTMGLAVADPRNRLLLLGSVGCLLAVLSLGTTLAVLPDVGVEAWGMPVALMLSGAWLLLWCLFLSGLAEQVGEAPLIRRFRAWMITFLLSASVGFVLAALWVAWSPSGNAGLEAPPDEVSSQLGIVQLLLTLLGLWLLGQIIHFFWLVGAIRDAIGRPQLTSR